MELLPRGQYNADYKQHEPKDISRSDDTIRYGVTWAGWKVLRRNEILSDLEDVFGVKNGKLIAAVALYKLDGHNAMMTFEDWGPQVWLPSICPVSGQRIPKLFERIDVAKVDEYYRRASNAP